jgi:hypothetical protein
MLYLYALAGKRPNLQYKAASLLCMPLLRSDDVSCSWVVDTVKPHVVHYVIRIDTIINLTTMMSQADHQSRTDQYELSN